jgi:hypothetical protein
VLLILVWFGLERAKARKPPTWWKPADAPTATAKELFGTIKCMVQSSEHNTWWRYKRTVNGETTYPYREKYYTDTQLQNYATWIAESVKKAGLPDKFFTIFVATLWQQTKFQYDLESRNNMKRTPIESAPCSARADCVEVAECAPPAKCACRGFRRVNGKRYKKRIKLCAIVEPLEPTTRRNQRPTRTVDGQDYGIFQHNWPVRWTTCGGKKCSLEDLLNPYKNIILAGQWFRRKGQKCHQWYTKVPRRRRPKCDTRSFAKQGSLACKCWRTHLATGGIWINGNPASIGRIQRRVEQCILKVRAGKKEDFALGREQRHPSL